MNWIANMSGPAFLSFYFIIILAVMISYYIFRYFSSSSSQRLLAFLSALLIIDGLGGYKLFVALSSGHSNVGFLIAMACISSFILLISLAKPRPGYAGVHGAAGTGVYFSTWDHSSGSSSCGSSSSCSSSSGGGCGGCGGGGGD